MGEELQKILELSRDPMVLAEDGRLSYLNSAARAAFYPAKTGDPAESLLPGELLERGAENAAFYGRVGAGDYSVRCARAGAGWLYAFREETRENVLLSDGVQRVTVITSDYHLPRALALARDLGLEADGIGSPCRPEIGFWIKNHAREVLAWGKYLAEKALNAR